jgi:hypothetical protein
MEGTLEQNIYIASEHLHITMIVHLMKLWQVQMCLDGKQTYLGSFDSEIQAAHAYDVYALKVHKVLNFPCEAAERDDSDAPTITRKVKCASKSPVSNAADSYESGGFQSSQPCKRKKIKLRSYVPNHDPLSSLRSMADTRPSSDDFETHTEAVQCRTFQHHHPAAALGCHQPGLPELKCSICWRAKRCVSVSPCNHMHLIMCEPCAMEISLESHVECPICGAPVALAVSRSMSNRIALLVVGEQSGRT